MQPYLRGTPHNALMLLNLIYKHHGLPPPVPTLNNFFLDNTMLMLPYEKAVKDWSTYFEPTLDKVLSPSQLETALHRNGMLLRLCGGETRRNAKLVDIAVKQNPEASQFAAKFLRGK